MLRASSFLRSSAHLRALSNDLPAGAGARALRAGPARGLASSGTPAGGASDGKGGRGAAATPYPLLQERDPSRPVRGALTLQDGRVFEGVSFGANKSISGEVVFNTGAARPLAAVTRPSRSHDVISGLGAPSPRDAAPAAQAWWDTSSR